MLVIMNTAPALCRERNRERDRPVPAPVLTDQLRKIKRLLDAAQDEGWDQTLIIEQHSASDAPIVVQPTPNHDHDPGTRPRVILQVSRFPWPEEDPAGWLRDLALTADEIGFDGLALMDHLIQIPQVDRAWEPIPEPWITLGMLAGLDTNLRLGTLVSPVTFREPGIIAKTVATLDVLSNGRAFCGLGAGWWLREHQAYGLDFPNDRQRLDRLQVCIETLRALWAPGTKAYHGRYVHLPETTCYPRPVSDVPIIVGGSGERRTLRIVAEQADGCNLPSDQTVLRSKIDILHRHCAALGRDPDASRDHRSGPAGDRHRSRRRRRPRRAAPRTYCRPPSTPPATMRHLRLIMRSAIASSPIWESERFSLRCRTCPGQMILLGAHRYSQRSVGGDH